jgi:hypothetical protein
MLSESLQQPVVLLNETDFIKYTSEWRIISNDSSRNLKPLFTVNDRFSNCILFSLSAVESLLSAEGVKAIKVRFCVHEINGEPVFNLVLFSTDSIGATNSAYYLGTPGILVSENGGPGGNIPDWLAKKWLTYWLELEESRYFSSEDIFSTRYGMLDGYNYDMLDILDALYADKPDYDAEYLCIHFALHRHYRAGVINPDLPTFTFNVVLQRVLFTDNNEVENIPKDDVFYDISSPSPPY